MTVQGTPAPRPVRVPIRADGSAGAPEPLATFRGTEWPDRVASAAGGAWLLSGGLPDRICPSPPEGGFSVRAEDPRGVIRAAPATVAVRGAALDATPCADPGRRRLTGLPAGIRGTRPHRPALGKPA